MFFILLKKKIKIVAVPDGSVADVASVATVAPDVATDVAGYVAGTAAATLPSMPSDCRRATEWQVAAAATLIFVECPFQLTTVEALRASTWTESREIIFPTNFPLFCECKKVDQQEAGSCIFFFIYFSYCFFFNIPFK